MGVNLSVSNRDISEEEGKGWEGITEEEERKGWEGRAMMEEHPLGTNKEVQETRQHWVLSRNELGNFVSSVTPTQEELSPYWVLYHLPGNCLGFTFYFHHSC